MSMNPNQFNLEEDLTLIMDNMLKVAMICWPTIPEPLLRSTIVATNLKALVNVILMGDDPDKQIRVNLKQVCLALLSLSDWLDPEEVTDAFPGNDGLPTN